MRKKYSDLYRLKEKILLDNKFSKLPKFKKIIVLSAVNMFFSFLSELIKFKYDYSFCENRNDSFRHEEVEIKHQEIIVDCLFFNFNQKFLDCDYIFQCAQKFAYKMFFVEYEYVRILESSRVEIRLSEKGFNLILAFDLFYFNERGFMNNYLIHQTSPFGAWSYKIQQLIDSYCKRKPRPKPMISEISCVWRRNLERETDKDIQKAYEFIKSEAQKRKLSDFKN